MYPKNALHDTDKNGKKIDEFVCSIHGLRHYERYDPNSSFNIRKSMTEGVNKLNKILGDNCEELTSQLFGVDNLNKKNDKYSNVPVDHSPIPEGVLVKVGETLVDLSEKVPQTKGRHYDHIQCQWSFGHFERDYGKDFDIYILYCLSQDGKIIEGYILNHQVNLKKNQVLALLVTQLIV